MTRDAIDAIFNDLERLLKENIESKKRACATNEGPERTIIIAKMQGINDAITVIRRYQREVSYLVYPKGK